MEYNRYISNRCKLLVTVLKCNVAPLERSFETPELEYTVWWSQCFLLYSAAAIFTGVNTVEVLSCAGNG